MKETIDLHLTAQNTLSTTLEVVGEPWRKINSKHCPVKLRTGDGVSVGACWHYLINGVCPAHGRIYGHNAVFSGTKHGDKP